MEYCKQCNSPCCNCSCPGCNCRILTGPNGISCCSICITGLQRIYSEIKIETKEHTHIHTNISGVQSPEYMHQILSQRLELEQLNRFK